MKERIQKFIDYKSITPGELADILGVQRSNISHILNGRNKPGAVFIEKFLLAFPRVNARWLFTGEGPMVMGEAKSSAEIDELKSEPEIPYITKISTSKTNTGKQKRTLEKVVLLYSDGSFVSYDPV
ncbi:MAG TPA: XRE family transcriptional regulator [Mariniphaga anaerophila]|uniref:XRE family transcriptional regulator n=1 Tax=Mariniphaga anaerophila TaxID=1484053 RepID=A0A831LT76_9BACT|nr:XRE family transcriptional regulator [Mariniphaga anaerophila]